MLVPLGKIKLAQKPQAREQLERAVGCSQADVCTGCGELGMQLLSAKVRAVRLLPKDL